ncbi:two-component regulator propeller domain-containing protein [Pseudochryseolinea flava]|uniref:histidine kinase n=1 Tax=Pseudochryseolinea flava TaxID=2059302 RepID=A0A364YCV6_9BACT|nr:two-component regulator propeller domain-containing protein [Pseudochryseolinea flava]RAW03488.1 hybrid sensor histidine kinase/response regulator [Pseudochryseolinea flava]
MKTGRYILIILLFVSCTGYSQSGKFFSVDADLSSSLVHDIYQDHNQVIWIATDNGLNRYDGSKFKVYKSDKNDSTSLLHNYVRVLAEDGKGRLFVGLVNGLQIYDDAFDSFQSVPLLMIDGNPFPAHVTTILQRKNGDILIGTTGHGIFILKNTNGKIFAQQLSSPMPSYLIKTLFEDTHQNLWICTQDKGLFRVDEHHRLTQPDIHGDSKNIFSLCEDSEGKLYAGSITTGLYTYNEKSDAFFPTLDTENRLPITKLLVTRSGRVLIGTEGRGLKSYDPKKREFSNADLTTNTVDLSRNKIHALLEDNAGNLWIGIFQKGIMLVPARTNRFQYYGHRSVSNDIIGSANVTALHKDRFGILWVGTDGDGVYALDAAGNRKAYFKPSGKSGSAPATILDIYEDSNDNLWLGSYDNGICVLNRATGQCQYMNNLISPDGEIPKVFEITEDKEKRLWIGTMGLGLYSLDLKTSVVEQFRAIGPDYRPDIDVLHNDWINAVLVSKNNKLYIGTADGLGCLDLNTGKFNTAFNGTNRLLAGLIVHTLHEDKNGTIWIGTSEGVVSYQQNQSGTQDSLMQLTTDHGLPSNVIFGILSDTLNHLWVSTNYGLSRIDKKTHSIVNFYQDDGLQGNEFSDAACVDGAEMFFGGTDGITFFDPSRITEEVKKIEVRVTGFYIHNQPVKKGMKSGMYNIVDTTVMNAAVFELSQKDNSFTIEFSVMEFSNPNRITYLYSLNGNGWIELAPGKNTVTFSDISPGDYEFRIRAKDHGTYSEAKIITITVHPLWYFSFWAKLCYALVAFVTMTVFIQQVRQRQEAKRKIQAHVHAKQLNDAKLQFFINIAHEIRTPVTLILSPLKKLITKDKDRERQRSYAAMDRNSNRILHLVNQLMDVQRIDRGQMMLAFQETEMVAFISDLCSAFDEQTRMKEIDLTYKHDMKALHAWIDPFNFDKVILNILANALKFTPVGGKINVALRTVKEDADLTTGQEYFQVEISDTGSGIREGELEKVFECFYQARDSHHNFSSGAGIGLHLTRSIVELHHGRIWSENNKNGKGCSFIFRLPLGNQHLNPEQMLIAEASQKTEHAFEMQAIPVVSTPEVKVKPKSTYRVLVVDDDPDILQYIRTEMASDYHMITCKDGKEALSYVLQHTPDVVVSDIKMPTMDGITLCQKIKQNVNINHIPVILLTAKVEEEYNLEGLGIGADGYLQKPFNVEILRKTIQNVIRTREILRNKFTGSQQQKDKVQDVVLASSNEKLLTRIMDAINKNIANPGLNVEMLSHEVGISRVHLHRKLKELTSQSTRDLIRNIRLQQAAKLISEKQMNITEVAFATGFTNIGHFSSAFKDFYGIPPSQYMENHLHTTKIKKSTERKRSN